LSEKFQRLVSVSLQHLPFETNFGSYEYHENLQIKKCPDFIPNIVFPTSLSREQPQASKEEITTHEISLPPMYLLPNKVLVTNNLDEENCL